MTRTDQLATPRAPDADENAEEEGHSNDLSTGSLPRWSC